MRFKQLSNESLLKIAQGLHTPSDEIDFGEAPAEVPDIDPEWSYKEPVQQAEPTVDLLEPEVDNAWVKDNINNIYELITELDQANKAQDAQIDEINQGNIGFESNIQDRVDVAFQDIQKQNELIEEIRKSLSEATPTNKVPPMANPPKEELPSAAQTVVQKPIQEAVEPKTTPFNKPEVAPDVEPKTTPYKPQVAPEFSKVPAKPEVEPKVEPEFTNSPKKPRGRPKKQEAPSQPKEQPVKQEKPSAKPEEPKPAAEPAKPAETKTEKPAEEKKSEPKKPEPKKEPAKAPVEKPAEEPKKKDELKPKSDKSPAQQHKETKSPELENKVLDLIKKSNGKLNHEALSKLPEYKQLADEFGQQGASTNLSYIIEDLITSGKIKPQNGKYFVSDKPAGKPVHWKDKLKQQNK